MIIAETKNFIAQTRENPHVSREDGGHIVIDPKKSVVDRTELSVELATELMLFTMLMGEAMRGG